MKPGPNQPCSCGSGRKYKKCCGSRSNAGPGERFPRFEAGTDDAQELRRGGSGRHQVGESWPEPSLHNSEARKVPANLEDGQEPKGFLSVAETWAAANQAQRTFIETMAKLQSSGTTENLERLLAMTESVPESLRWRLAPVVGARISALDGLGRHEEAEQVKYRYLLELDGAR